MKRCTPDSAAGGLISSHNLLGVSIIAQQDPWLPSCEAANMRPATVMDIPSYALDFNITGGGGVSTGGSWFHLPPRGLAKPGLQGANGSTSVLHPLDSTVAGPPGKLTERTLSLSVSLMAPASTKGW